MINIICAFLKPRDICKLARLNKEHLQLLYNSQVWKKNIWNTSLTENQVKELTSNPLLCIGPYKYCYQYHICELEAIIYSNQIYDLWQIANVTDKQLWDYVNILQSYYIICENPDREFLYKLYFNYQRIFTLIKDTPSEILKETFTYSLLFQEFYYGDYHVSVRRSENIIIDNKQMPKNYLDYIENSQWPLHQLIKLFITIRTL